MQLFTREDHRRVVAGEITTTFRLWKSPHVKPGAVYPTPWGGAYRILDVRLVAARDLGDADAWAAGFPDRAALLRRVAAHTKARIAPGTTLYRVDVAYDVEAPRKRALSVDEALARLARLDRATTPWTRTALELIERLPRVVARALAAEVGWETLPFKVNVRKLKALGLTTSHAIGYELTPLGQACLDRLRARGGGSS